MKILFLGFNHLPNDPRLFHREMRLLKLRFVKIKLFFLSSHRLRSMSEYFNDSIVINEAAKKRRNIKVRKLPWLNQYPVLTRLRGIYDWLIHIYQDVAESYGRIILLPQVLRLHPDIIQASDIRELHWAVFFHLFTNARIVYDVHEDYFNQIYEFGDKSWFSFLRASGWAAVELLLVPWFHAVFCADDYLLAKYSKPVYRCKKIALLRNFPLAIDFPVISSYPKKDELDLVYIGSVNRYKGVIECAEYVAKFNQKFAPLHKLSFTVYSQKGPIIDNLVERGMIRHIDRIDYLNLLSELIRYDVGICLWLELDKLRHNLPLKNFDYMSVGLPIITSNFGNLQKYAQLSGSSVCINPLNYEEFEKAVLLLFDPVVRKQLSENGIHYTRSAASFDKEAEEYLTVMSCGMNSCS